MKPHHSASSSCNGYNMKQPKWVKEKEQLKPEIRLFEFFPNITVSTGRLVIFAAAICCYANSLSGDFVFDDAEAVVNNRDVRSTGGNSVWEIFTHDYWGYPIRSNTSHKSYRPLTTLTFRYCKELCIIPYYRIF